MFNGDYIITINAPNLLRSDDIIVVVGDTSIRTSKLGMRLNFK